MNNIVYTKATIYRNVKDYKFTPKLENEKKEEIIEKLKLVLTDFELINIQNATAKTINYLKANYLYNENIKNLFLDTNNNVCVNLFDGEHLSIISTQQSSSEKVLKRVMDVAEKLSNSINLAYSDEFGFLMSDITKIGSGLKLDCEIVLNGIEMLGKIEQIKQNLGKLGFNLVKTKQTSTYKLSTVCTLGKTSKNVYEEFEKMLNQLQEIEVESLKMLDVQNHDAMLDEVMRSYALLTGSYLMGYDELSTHTINLIKGMNLGYIDLDIKAINSLRNLVKDTAKEFISQTELKEIALKTKQILKGDQ